MKLYLSLLTVAVGLILPNFAYAQKKSVPPAAKYRLLKKIALGGEGSWDYPAFDGKNHRLYVSHESEIVVVDTTGGEVVGRIQNASGVHGIAPVPAFGKVFISEGEADAVGIFDLKTLSSGGKIAVGKAPDAIVFDPATKRLFTSNGDGADMTAFNAADGKVVGTIPLGGDPESIAVDGKGQLFLAIADKNAIVNIDTKKLAVKNRWTITGCEVPKSVALDIKHKRLFVGCRNHLLAVIDAKNGHAISTISIGERVDTTIFDAATGMIFNSCGDGTVYVIHEDSPDKFSLVEIVRTLPGAKTMAYDPATRQLFLPVAENFKAADAATGQKAVWGDFVLLIYGQ